MGARYHNCEEDRIDLPTWVFSNEQHCLLSKLEEKKETAAVQSETRGGGFQLKSA